MSQLFAYPFMVNAFRAGTIVAVTAAAIGWFMVLRRETFVGHTLSLVAFPGAAGATLVGVGAVYGFFAFAIGAAAVIAAVPARGHGEESALTGTVQAFALALGFLFVALYHGFLGGLNALLFGTFLGITNDQVVTLLVAAAVSLAMLAVIGRPLLFSSIDPAVATARGLSTRLLSTMFLMLLAVAAAETSQITGTLLVFALLVMPAATAQQLSGRPAVSLPLAALIALAVVWSALAAAYYSDYPIGFYATSIAFGLYTLARIGVALTR